MQHLDYVIWGITIPKRETNLSFLDNHVDMGTFPVKYFMVDVLMVHSIIMNKCDDKKCECQYVNLNKVTRW